MQTLTPPIDYTQLIVALVRNLPADRAKQLYDFARFLLAESRSPTLAETEEEIAADEALWDAQFAATDDDKLAALVASVEAEIKAGKTLPMFDEHGEFVEHP